MTKAALFRKNLKEKKLIRLVGAHNGLTAKLVEEAGFEGIWASGLEISTSYALPDANILTMTEFLAAAVQMNSATSLPIIADCDTGFGNSSNVIHMVRMYESSGIAGVCIEDKTFPKINSFIEGRQELAPIHEFVGKILAAKNTKTSDDFLVFARVEALIAGWGQEEAMRRAIAYANAGADGILIHSKSKIPDEIIEFIKNWELDIPLIIVPTKYPSLTEEEMVKLGVKVAIYANHGLRSSIKSIRETFNEIAQHGLKDIDSKISTLNEVFALQGLFQMMKNEEKYLKGKYDNYSAIILAAGIPTGEEELLSVVKNIPMALIDINGKTLLKRNIENLNKVGINNIYTIVGYKKELYDRNEFKIIENNNHKDTHTLYSLMKAKKHFRENLIVIYSDIIFHADIIKQLLSEHSADVVIVMDSTCRTLRQRNKKLECVAVKEKKGLTSHRNINSFYTVENIEVNMNEDITDGEFIGIVKFSKKTTEELQKIDENKNSLKGLSLKTASLSDIIKMLISKNFDVKALDVNSGWTEIHTFQKYKYICSKIK